MTLIQLKYAIAVSESHSFSEAAKKLYISQPSLSCSIKDLEDELGMELFHRSSKGITVSSQGKEFLGYARQVVENYKLIESKYINNDEPKKRFSVSTQHYTFAVDAFVEVANQFGMNEYEFALYETRTNDIIEDVKNFRSEIGILYLDSFNREVLTKLFHEYNLEFHPIMDCNVYVYLWKRHPLANRKSVTMEDLDPYPNLSFDQGDNNSFYFSEEVLSTYDHKRIIKVNDRATILNLMIGLQGYTLCSGIICSELNGSGDYVAVKLRSDEVMTVGYLTRKDIATSPLAELYIESISKYKDQVLA